MTLRADGRRAVLSPNQGEHGPGPLSPPAPGSGPHSLGRATKLRRYLFRILTSLALYGDGGGVLDLDPGSVRSGAVRRVDLLRHDPLDTELARMRKGAQDRPGVRLSGIGGTGVACRSYPVGFNATPVADMWGCVPSGTPASRIPAKADSDSDRLRTAIPIDRGQRSGERGQQFPSTA